MYRVELYARVRRACHVEGMSTREASRVFGVDRKTVRKMLSFSVPPGYRRSAPPRRPKLGPFRRRGCGATRRPSASVSSGIVKFSCHCRLLPMMPAIRGRPAKGTRGSP